jgi:hypothetical protein
LKGLIIAVSNFITASPPGHQNPTNDEMGNLVNGHALIMRKEHSKLFIMVHAAEREKGLYKQLRAPQRP